MSNPPFTPKENTLQDDTDELEMQPDAARVIARLSGRIGDLESENAQLHDVVRQLLEQRNTAARDTDATAGRAA